MDLRVLYVEVGRIPRIWRSLGTLIRDRRDYTIVNHEEQYKSNLLYTTGHIATFLFFLSTENTEW